MEEEESNDLKEKKKITSPDWLLTRSRCVRDVKGQQFVFAFANVVEK